MMPTRTRKSVRSLMRYLLEVMGKLMVVVATVLVIMLAFYWDFGFEDVLIKSIPTEGGRITEILINAEFFLVLITIVLFYTGFRVFTGAEEAEGSTSVVVESRKAIILKYFLSILLGVIGIWVIYREFSRAYLWSYYTPKYVQVSRQVTISETTIPLSLVLTTIALLLLLNWYLIVEVHFGYRKLRETKAKRDTHVNEKTNKV